MNCSSAQLIHFSPLHGLDLTDKRLEVNFTGAELAEGIIAILLCKRPHGTGDWNTMITVDIIAMQKGRVHLQH